MVLVEKRADGTIMGIEKRPDGTTVIMPIDRLLKLREAKAGQRQRAIVLARIEINDEETGFRYPHLQDALPTVFEDSYYPEDFNNFLRRAEDSLTRYVKSLQRGRKQAREIADEIRGELSCDDLTDGEIIEVVTRQMAFRDFAIRIGLKTEDNFYH